MAWFRLHESTLDNPKVQNLPEKLFKGWVNLLCVASRYGGRLPEMKDIAFALRRTPDQAAKLLDELIAAELIDKDDQGLTPHDWNEHQYKSDVSTGRVRAFRERNGGSSKKRDETVSRNAPEQSRAETEQSRQQIDAAFAAFSAAAARKGWPKPKDCTPDRRRKIQARLSGHGMDGWQTVIAKGEASSLINEGGWWSLDWLLKPANFTKVIEGNYDNRPGTGPPQKAGGWN